MAALKRGANSDSAQAKKKQKTDKEPASKNATPAVSVLRPEEVDFPRGGGSTLPPVEYKKVRAEALKELKEEDIFRDASRSKKQVLKKKSIKSKAGEGKSEEKGKSNTSRVEHLNYKRLAPGMKVLCQVLAVQPFALIVSLPNQLLGHVPITQISSELTALLEQDAHDEDEDFEEDEEDQTVPPELHQLFRPGQYLRAIVTSVKAAGTSEGGIFRHARDEVEKTSRRVELSLVPEQVNSGLSKSDLVSGMTLSAAVKSVEDHGYLLNCGIGGISGFLPFTDGEEKLSVGSIITAAVSKLADNGRSCTFTADNVEVKKATVKELSSVAAVLPGVLVQALITAVVPSGLNVQILGSLKGTIDLYHLTPGSLPKYKEGQKIKFCLSLNSHVLALDVRKRSKEDGQSLDEAFPVGTFVPSVKVERVESERGLVVLVEPGVEGFVHISHVSDDHVPSLSSNSGPWKVDTVHQARVIGYHPLDGILQLSMRPSVLAQKFLRVNDVQPGEIVKGTVKKLTDSALFVSINGSVDAMIWPLHYADILLKHPQKRFKPGSSVKCRVLSVDPERKRILLTAKKTLVESDLPIISSLEDAKAGLVTHGVVVKILDKSVIVEFYNGVRSIIPAKEVTETPPTRLDEAAPLGKTVKVRIIRVDRDASRVIASIRQAVGENKPPAVGDINSIETGQIVKGKVTAIHRDNVVLALDPTGVTALISLNNIANKRSSNAAEVRASLKPGDELDDLLVVSRNLDKGIVIVANTPRKTGSSQPLLHLKDVTIGMRVKGRISKHTRSGAIVKFSGHLVGTLHPTDMSDEYDATSAFPAVGSEVEAVVISVDKSRRTLGLSTRQSRMQEGPMSVKDPEIDGIRNLKVGQVVRGFIKNITDHGIYVTLGRSIDARVQIRELYDDYVKDWKDGFVENQVVSGRILKIDEASKQVEMSFRSESSAGSSKLELVFEDLSVGQQIQGAVKKVEPYGIFIAIEGTKLSGLCHKSEITDNKEADVDLALRNFKEGDAVKAVITAIDKERKRISLSMKPSLISDGGSYGESQGTDGNTSVSGEEPEETSKRDTRTSSDAEESEDRDEVVMDVDEVVHPTANTSNQGFKSQVRESSSIPTLPLQGGFQWTASSEPVADEFASESESEDDGQPGQKKAKKKKKKIQEDLTADMHTRLPQSNADFERHLLSSPDSSFLWIQYMSFQLQLSEIEKAREIGRRALQAINIREEQEKLNVWIALMNIENVYGTEESLETVFRDAARHNDSKTVHLRLASILDQSDKHERAEEQYKRTCKKFGYSSKVWTLFAEHYFRRGKLEEARKLLPRSLLSLEKRKHLKTISKFAQLEYKLGDPERGKTIFEGIIDSHPKRFDLWSIYMDMEAVQKDIQSVRNLFERVLAIKMTSHKAKSFFKKWLAIEKRIGDEEGENLVKEKAIEWTQRASGTS